MLHPIPREAVAVVLGTLLIAAAPAHAEPSPPTAQEAAAPRDVLGIGDRISVRVLGRPEVSGEFEIGRSGAVRLPLLGAVTAQGRSPAELEQDVADELSERMAYAVQVAVDVVAYHPIFVVGEVAQPGTHPYRPGMTVFQAYATAGGQPVMRHLPSDRSMEASASVHRLRQAQSRLRALMVGQAAIDAALDGKTEITLPPALQAAAETPAVQELVRHEQNIIVADQERLKSIHDALNRQYLQLEEEVASLVNEGKALARQQTMIAREVSNMQSLRDKGLTTSARMLDLEQSLSGIEATRHRQSAYLTRARQQQVRLERDLAEAREEWKYTLLRRRLENAAAIEIAQAELEASNARMASMSLADTALSDPGLGPMRLVFIVMRSEGNRTTEILADGGLAMHPGDILEVRVESADPMAAQAPSQRVMMSN